MNTLRTSWSTTSSTWNHDSRSAHPTPDHVIATGDLVIDARSREVMRSGDLIDVTKTEFDLLLILATQPRQVFTARQLFQFVWSSHYFDADHVIETHISRLRRKLGESGNEPRYIHTVRGVGYRFEPQPGSTESPGNPPDRYRVRLTPNLAIAEIDTRLADILRMDARACLGHPIAEILHHLTISRHLQLTTRPLRDASGSLTGIELLVQPTPGPGTR